MTNASSEQPQSPPVDKSSLSAMVKEAISKLMDIVGSLLGGGSSSSSSAGGGGGGGKTKAKKSSSSKTGAKNSGGGGFAASFEAKYGKRWVSRE